MVKRIETRAELVRLAAGLGVSPDWHEPDQQQVHAVILGARLNNAGFWGGQEIAFRQSAPELGLNDDSLELWAVLLAGGEPVAEVNLAMLFAWATGYEDL